MNDFKMRELADMKETLVSALKGQLSNIDMADTKEVGEVVDMIKDLAEAEKCCFEACYYKTVIEAMEEGSNPKYGYSKPMHGDYGVRGLDNMGYRPMLDQEPYIDGYLNDPDFNYKMGYSRRPSMGNRSMRYGYIDPETMDSAMGNVKDIWNSADSEKKKSLKKELMAMISEMD